jgi:RNA polymerase sigma-70 factor (ECF subfamily)
MERDATTEALLARWRAAGDREALDELLREEVELLKRRLRRRGDGHDVAASASDVAQEAVLRLLALEPPPRFHHAGELRAYLWRAAWNLLVDRLRQHRGQQALEVEPDAPSSAGRDLATSGGLTGVERQDGSLAISLAVNLLAEEERSVLRLVYWSGLDLASAARELGISSAAANMRLVRARRHLARKLKDWAELVG